MSNVIAFIVGMVVAVFLCDRALARIIIPASGIVSVISTEKITLDGQYFYPLIPGVSLGDTLVMTVHKKAEIK